VHNETNSKEGGWELIAGKRVTLQVDLDEGMAVEADISKTKLWICNLLFAAEHVDTGSFDTTQEHPVLYHKVLIRAQFFVKP